MATTTAALRKYLVAAVSLAAFVFAVWRCWGSRLQTDDVRYPQILLNTSKVSRIAKLSK
jgi:hypothetical protein